METEGKGKAGVEWGWQGRWGLREVREGRGQERQWAGKSPAAGLIGLAQRGSLHGAQWSGGDWTLTSTARAFRWAAGGLGGGKEQP